MTPISLSQIPLFKSTPTQFQTVIFASTHTFYVGDNDGELSETHEGKDNGGIYIILARTRIGFSKIPVSKCL